MTVTPRETPMDYAAANRLWRRHRTALTRALNKAKPDLRLSPAHRERLQAEAWQAVLALVAEQQAEWDALGWPWPDDWSRWDRAARDAESWLRWNT